MSTILSAHQIREARRLRSRGRRWAFIARYLCVSPDTVRRVIDPEWRTTRNSMIAAAKRTSGGSAHWGWKNPMVANRSVDVPGDVLADRDARLNAPRSLTATICGDPAAGQSALDKKCGPSP